MSLSFLLDDPVDYEGRINAAMDSKSSPFYLGDDPPVFRSVQPVPRNLGPRSLGPMRSMDASAIPDELHAIPSVKKAPLVEIKDPVPPPPPAGHLERTHVQTTAKPSKVMKDLKEILEDLNVDYEPTDMPFQYACVYYPGAERVGFMCTLFEKTPGNVVLEVQRRGGDVMKFYRKYQDLIDAAAEKKLVVARDPTKFHVRKAVTLDDEWMPTEEEIRDALEPLICMAGSGYLDVSSRAVESLCEISKDAKAASWLVKNGHVADAKKLAGSEWEVLHRPAVSWIANMARNKELCESLATAETLKIMALRLGSNCKEVVREASRALKNLSVVLGPKKILSAAKISDATAQRMENSKDRRTKAAWREILRT